MKRKLFSDFRRQHVDWIKTQQLRKDREIVAQERIQAILGASKVGRNKIVDELRLKKQALQ